MQCFEYGYVFVFGYLQCQLVLMLEFYCLEMLDFMIYEYYLLMDLFDMIFEDWQYIVDDICSYYEEYDGFVIFYGIDIMVFIVLVLLFMLENFGKLVIVIGL